MGDSRRAKRHRVISGGSLCCVRNYYVGDVEPDPHCGIVLDLLSKNFDNYLYSVLVGDEIVERNDLEIELIQNSDLQLDVKKS